jgi:hypothetical protein
MHQNSQMKPDTPGPVYEITDAEITKTAAPAYSWGFGVRPDLNPGAPFLQTTTTITRMHLLVCCILHHCLEEAFFWLTLSSKQPGIFQSPGPIYDVSTADRLTTRHDRQVKIATRERWENEVRSIIIVPLYPYWLFYFFLTTISSGRLQDQGLRRRRLRAGARPGPHGRRG